MAMSLALFAPGLFFLSGHRMDEAAFLFLFGGALSIATQFGSNTRIFASSGMLIPSSMAAILMLFCCVRVLRRFFEETAPDGGENRKSYRAVAGVTLAGTLACLLALVGLMGLRLTTTYRDGPMTNLTVKITDGPAKGLITSAEEAKKYERLITDIRENAPRTGNILVSNLFPDGYMLTNLAPAAPGEFNMSIGFLSSYYAQHPERWPDYIFAIDESYGRTNELSASISETLTKGMGYKAIQLESGTAYILQMD
jgi:hypothetical protein